jgi:hypothetical protein
MVKYDFYIKIDLRKRPLYLGWHPTVDTALIPPLSHPVFKDQTSQAIDRGLRRPRTQHHLQKTSHHL